MKPMDGRGIEDTRDLWARVCFPEFAEAHPALRDPAVRARVAVVRGPVRAGVGGRDGRAGRVDAVEHVGCRRGRQLSGQVAIDGFAPLLFIPAPHFFIGFGPRMYVDVTGAGATQKSFGLSSEIGGYF